MNASSKKYLRLRIVIVSAFLFLFLLTIGARSVYLQIMRREWLASQASSQVVREQVRVGKRGAILDRKGHEMAVSVEATSVAAYPLQISDATAAAPSLADALTLDAESLYRKISTARTFVWVKRQVTPRELDAVKRLNIKGVDFITEYKRVYPNKTLAAQLLGFTGIDGHGLEGLEFHYDRVLIGSRRERLVHKDALGRSIARAGTADAAGMRAEAAGGSIMLTIDHTIQYITETALEQAVAEFNAASGVAIVMDPETGAVLATACVPLFNPNVFGRYPEATWRNRAVTDSFEPGSTMKIFTAAAALSSGCCSPSTIFFCENGSYRIGGNTIHDTHPRGWLSLQQIIKYSSNIGVTKVIETVGAETLHSVIRRFGFGDQTGIDCPAETAGMVAPPSRWTRIDTGAISFGQGIAVSPVQLAAATAAIANGGRLMRPYVVDALIDSRGQVVERARPRLIQQAVPPETAETVKRILKTVITEGGTGVSAALEGYSVAGKTGTAQKIDPDGTYADGRFVASFVGFAPADDPAVVVLVIVDEPRAAHYGGTVAAPAFRRIVHDTLIYLDIPPDQRKTDLRVSLEKGVRG